MNQHIKISKILCVYHNHFSTGFDSFNGTMALIPLLDSELSCTLENSGISESSNNKINHWKNQISKESSKKVVTFVDRFTVFSSNVYWVVANHSDPQAGTPPRYPHKVISKCEALFLCASKLTKLEKKLKRGNAHEPTLGLLIFSQLFLLPWVTLQE